MSCFAITRFLRDRQTDGTSRGNSSCWKLDEIFLERLPPPSPQCVCVCVCVWLAGTEASRLAVMMAVVVNGLRWLYAVGSYDFLPVREKRSLCRGTLYLCCWCCRAPPDWSAGASTTRVQRLCRRATSSSGHNGAFSLSRRSIVGVVIDELCSSFGVFVWFEVVLECWVILRALSFFFFCWLFVRAGRRRSLQLQSCAASLITWLH